MKIKRMKPLLLYPYLKDTTNSCTFREKDKAHPNKCMVLGTKAWEVPGGEPSNMPLEAVVAKPLLKLPTLHLRCAFDLTDGKNGNYFFRRNEKPV